MIDYSGIDWSDSEEKLSNESFMMAQKRRRVKLYLIKRCLRKIIKKVRKW